MYDNPSLQNNDAILKAIAALAGSQAIAVPTPTIPALNFTPPSGADMDAKYKEFLDRAAKDPDIIKYYQNLLNQAKGDTELAKSFIEKDYTTGVRQTQDTLKATLEGLGLTFGQEQRTLEDTLNKRGIALTQAPGGGTTYAGGGQAGQELGNLNESQKLRQEAEQRSAGQKIEGMGLTRTKGLTSAGQGLQQAATSMKQQEQSDILGRANTYYGIYQNQKAAEANKAQQDQSNKASGATPPPYKPNTVNQTVEYGGTTWRGQPGGEWA